MFKHVLIAFDGSPSSRKALEVGVRIAQASEAVLSLVSVEEHMPRFPGDIGEVKDEKERQNNYFATLQREARDVAKLRGLDFDRAVILVGHVAHQIIDHARAIQCDLIVMGHSSGSGVWANFLGGTAEKVTRYAHCTVIIVR